MSYKKNINLWWKNIKNLDTQLKYEMKNMNNYELQDAFTKNLEFGTSGFRGLIGAGTNRINIFTIRRLILAFIYYLQLIYSKIDLKNKGIILCHDNRHFSYYFFQEIMNILLSYNIKVILFKNNNLIPTPLVSYSIKKNNAIAGIMITASHNSREYNGCKFYNKYGSQLLPLETNIIKKKYLNIKLEIFNLFLSPNVKLISYVSKKIEQNYINDIKNMQFYFNKKRNIKIIFSNLHGISKEWTPKILKECGYKVYIVKEQYLMDSNFTNAPNPNPELTECYNLAIKYAKKKDAHIIILNDPDADRLGIAIKISKGKYYLMTANETAPILIEYLFSHYKKRKKIPNNGIMYNTFVTSDLSDKIAKSYGVKVIKTLTGFKWISSQILLCKKKKLKFLFGFEESYGYLLKDFTLDKDGIQTSLVIAEACWMYYNQGKTLYDVLNELYNKFGFYYCYTFNFFKYGEKGKIIINKILQNLRNKKICILNNIKCIKIEDYLLGLYNMPSQDLLKFYFEDGSWIAVRASGTEPKIKFYFVCIGESIEMAKHKMELMFKELENKYLK